MARTAQYRQPTVLDPQALTLSSVYADALMQATPELPRAQELADELEALADVLERTPGATELLVGAAISPEEREGLARKVFGGRVSAGAEAFLAVLARRGRMELIAPIAADFRRRLNAREGKVEIVLTTAQPVDGEQAAALAGEMERALNAPATLRTRVDESILGGAVLRVGDRNFDASIASQLRRLRRRMAAGAFGAIGRATP